MQTTNKIRDKIKPQVIRAIPASASIRPVTNWVSNQNNYILFFPGYYSHLGVLLVHIFTMPISETEIISMATQHNILSNQILNKGSAE